MQRKKVSIFDDKYEQLKLKIQVFLKFYFTSGASSAELSLRNHKSS